jgi:putative acetyltransferase
MLIGVRRIEKNDVVRCIELMKHVLSDYLDDVRMAISVNEERDFWELYSAKGAAFFVYVLDEEIIGTLGISPVVDAVKNICEMQRFFLLKEARGNGYGKQLYSAAVSFAKNEGYEGIYLETLPAMEEANVFYKKQGFQDLEKPLTQTGHSCHSYKVKWF